MLHDLDLQPRFDALWARAVGFGDPSATWRRLDAGYGDCARTYHGWAHIAAMLADFDAVRAEPEFAKIRTDEVELALFFHDAVYDPRRSDNERASAILFGEETSGDTRLGGDGRDRIDRLILATAEHRPSLDPATQLLLDLDLAVLGASPPAYAGYAEAVRREYGHVSEGAWRQGRAFVLRRFLDRDQIFQSAVFARRLEDSARANLARELAALDPSKS